MMISPEAYYDAYLKNKSVDEIKKKIRSLKKEIGHLKNIMEDPNYMPTMRPDESTQLWCTKMYLEKAIQALEENGETYFPSKTEIKIKQFNDMLKDIKEIKFMIGGFFQGHSYYTITIDGDNVEKRVTEIHLDKDSVDDSFDMNKEELIEGLISLDLGEWKRKYEDYLVCDGTQWELELHFYNGYKARKYYGSNQYPYNFNDLLQVLDVNEDEDDEFDIEYTIELEDVKDLLSRMFDKIKELPIGTEISTSELLSLISNKHSYEDGNYVYDELILDTCDMFSIDYELKTESTKYGIVLDTSIHDGEVLGMPFNIGFLIKSY